MRDSCGQAAARALPSGAALKFVYDCPDFEEFDIFSNNAAGKAQLDADALRQADEHNVMLKNPRDDRFTLLAIPAFVFMGSMLESSGIAERLLETMGRLLGRLASFFRSVTGALRRSR